MPVIDLTLRTISGDLVNGRLRVELDIVSSDSNNVFIPSVQTVDVVDGEVSVTVPADINATYWFGESESVVLYKLGGLSPASSGDFGTKVRQAASQSVGTQDYMTVTGGMLAAASPPVAPVTIAIVSAAIGKDGTIFVPTEGVITVDDLTSFYSLSLPYTDDLYDANGATPLLRLIQNRIRIGTGDFEVPSATSGTFIVENGAVLIIEA